jgi:hypothetical protein
MQEML